MINKKQFDFISQLDNARTVESRNIVINENRAEVIRCINRFISRWPPCLLLFSIEFQKNKPYNIYSP